MNTTSHPFLSELAEIHGTESRIAMALSKMNKAGISADLKMEILSQMKETEGNITEVEVIQKHFSGPTGQADLESAAQDYVKRSRDLGLNSNLISIHKAGPSYNGSRHAWEMAAYGYLHEWDGLSRRVDAAKLLEAIIEDERNEARSPAPDAVPRDPSGDA